MYSNIGCCLLLVVDNAVSTRYDHLIELNASHVAHCLFHVITYFVCVSVHCINDTALACCFAFTSFLNLLTLFLPFASVCVCVCVCVCAPRQNDIFVFVVL